MRAILVFIIFQLVMITGQASALHGPPVHVLFEKNSLYQYIRIEENSDKRERHILVNNSGKDPERGIQGGISLDDPEKLIFEYYRMAFTSLAFIDREPEDVLFVGLGAGAMPKYFYKYYRNANIDVVELDPDVFEAAKEYLYFSEEEKMKVHISDGRVFVKRTPKKYDMIFLDAYKGDSIPFHLTTREFLKEVKQKLKKGGVVISNITAESKNQYFWSMIKTYLKEFPQLSVFRGEDSMNFIFVAPTIIPEKEASVILAQAEEIQADKGIDLSLITKWSWNYQKNNSKIYRVRVLTDDFAPVNLLRYKEMKN